MFTIYSIGDSAFLAQILNSLAMITGTGSFKQLVAIGMMLGLFVVSIQCVFNAAKEFNIHQVFVGFICYLCMFGTGVTVHIEDAYTGNVRTVANVPIGAGIAGAAISNLGYGVTKLFEQGYGDVDRMTDHSFAESLKSLNEIRSISYDVSILDALNAQIGGNADIRRSIDNYFRECTFPSIIVGQNKLENIYKGGIDQLKFNNKVYGTNVILPGAPANGNMNCDDAYALISEKLKEMNSPQVMQAFNRLSHKVDGNGQITNNFDHLENALQTMNYGGTTAIEYMKMAVLQPIYEQAAKGFHLDMGDTSSSIMINQAITQRNTQWASEQTMFMSTVRPLLAFFEGFIYAITPFMAFLMVTGSFGIGMVGKYFQIVVWMQLWLPVLSIINLYINMAARNEFASIATTPVSFYTINNASQVLQTWVSVGGMLAAATPLIALFLVTGSSFAFTTLTGRMAGRDHINEKITTPDLVQPGALLGIANQNNSTSSQGTIRSGTESSVPTVNMASALSNQAQSFQSKLHSASNSVGRDLAHAISNGLSTNESQALTQSAGRNLQQSHSELYNALKSKVSQTQDTSGWSEEQFQGAIGSMAVSAGGSLGWGNSKNESDGLLNQEDLDYNNKSNNKTQKSQFENYKRSSDAVSKAKNIGFSGAMNGTYQSNVGVKEGITTASSHSETDSFNFSKNDSKAMQEAVSKAVQFSDTTTLSKLQSSTDSDSLKKSIGDVLSAQEGLQKTQAQLQSFGSSTSVRLDTFADMVNNNQRALEATNQATMGLSMSEKDQINHRAETLKNHNGYDSKRAMTMARLEAIGNQDKLALASIYSTSAGTEQGNLNQVKKTPSGIDSIRRVSQSEGDQLKQGFSYNEKEHNDSSRLYQTEAKDENGRVKSASNDFMGQHKTAREEMKGEMKQKVVDNALEQLKHEPEKSNMLLSGDVSGKLSDGFSSSIPELAREIQKQTNLTDTQAKAWGELRGSWSSFANSLTGIGTPSLSEETRSELKNEVKAMFNNQISDNKATEITRLMEDRLMNSALAGRHEYLNSIKNFNKAIKN